MFLRHIAVNIENTGLYQWC